MKYLILILIFCSSAFCQDPVPKLSPDTCMQNFKLTLYTTGWCMSCERLKKNLATSGRLRENGTGSIPIKYGDKTYQIPIELKEFTGDESYEKYFSRGFLEGTPQFVLNKDGVPFSWPSMRMADKLANILDSHESDRTQAKLENINIFKIFSAEDNLASEYIEAGIISSMINPSEIPLFPPKPPNAQLLKNMGIIQNKYAFCKNIYADLKHEKQGTLELLVTSKNQSSFKANSSEINKSLPELEAVVQYVIQAKKLVDAYNKFQNEQLAISKLNEDSEKEVTDSLVPSKPEKPAVQQKAY